MFSDFSVHHVLLLCSSLCNPILKGSEVIKLSKVLCLFSKLQTSTLICRCKHQLAFILLYISVFFVSSTNFIFDNVVQVEHWVKEKGHYTIVIIATRIFLEWFALNVQCVQILTFAQSAFLLEVKLLLIKVIIHIGLWLVTFLNIYCIFMTLLIQGHGMILVG